MKLPNFKKNFFWEPTSVYAFHLTQWSYHQTNLKMIFLSIFMFENYIFCYFCSNLFKKCDNLNGRYNFFCICCLARLNIYVRRLLLYFQKNKKFLKLANFSRTPIFPFFGRIWAKMAKNAIFEHKNGQKYHFRAGFMIRPLCQM